MSMPDVSLKQGAALLVFWGAVMLAIGYFSRLPAVTVHEANETSIKLVIRYSGKRLGECTPISAAAQEDVQPNMRQAMSCPRGKSPLLARLVVNGETRFEDTIKPSGLHNDGVIAAYQRIPIEAGLTTLHLGIRDDERIDGFTHELTRDLRVPANKIVTIHFADNGFKVSGT
ncbi:MAG: hypothetical protein U5O39_02205 [Gammaproteobacteria bacterium]|nr:hypothetical protein [Gammaproteobacteria bacterium]